jgi:hypothetical protein
MGAAQRYLTAGLAVAAAEAGFGLVLLPASIAAYLFAVAAATALFAIATRRLLEPAGEGGHGGTPKAGDGPPPGPPEPPWWPEFETDLRQYVHEREQRLTSVHSAS